MSVLGHLEELRTRLFKMLLAFGVGCIAAWFFYEDILHFLIQPLKQLPVAEQIISQGNLIFTAPTEAFFIRLKITAFAGFVLALPVILWQLWRFVTPGLHRKEKRYAIPFVFVSMVLFCAGVAFAFTTLPRALDFLASFSGTELVLLPRASEYLSFVLILIAGFGVTFEFPLVLLALTLIGVVSSQKLRRVRKVAYVTILIVAAIVTPTQDPVTLMMMSVPLGLLYEATILVARLMKK
ncbi:MAG: twin-arginine translocase subunit TatC [Actinomycetota bacterium]